MQKIMFNDQYGLTKAVLEGKKTQTRRIMPESWLEGLEEFQEDYFNDTLDHIERKDLLEQYFLIEQRKKPHFAVGETLAVAQSYRTLWETDPDALVCTEASQVEAYFAKHYPGHTVEQINRCAGWSNKMFVQADLMPHQIRITGIRLERLQDISNEDCLKEGIQKCSENHQIGYPIGVPFNYFICEDKKGNRYTTPKEAYAALIDKISGKGTWEKNPWVFVYDFELVK